MPTRVTIIRGHPDPAPAHLNNALAAAYARGAAEAGHQVEEIAVATLDVPLLRSAEDFVRGAPPEALVQAQQAILRAQHLAIFFPLWLGEMPALLKAFFEQTFRPTFGEPRKVRNPLLAHPLRGRSARVVVTMGMPALFYRWYFGAHGVKNLERNVLRFSGIAPVRTTFFGGVDTASDGTRARWIARMHELGRTAR
ncbi:MAG TPA: NAD(P)H-dependent oxidoreductase [Candidatus Limnocylindria bacterium]|nr:NAD(P)H-dependent oxidoreductase [Candidatus Limnocylindria bacterium]